MLLRMIRAKLSQPVQHELPTTEPSQIMATSTLKTDTLTRLSHQLLTEQNHSLDDTNQSLLKNLREATLQKPQDHGTEGGPVSETP